MIFLEHDRIDELLDSLMSHYPNLQGTERIVAATTIAVLCAVAKHEAPDAVFKRYDDTEILARAQIKYLTQYLHGDTQ